MTAPAPIAPAVASPSTVGHWADWIGVWSRPAGRPAEVALIVGVALLAAAFVPGGPRWLGSFLELATFADLGRRRRFLILASFCASFLSLGYIAYYLRGGPRAPDAAMYWLQGRAIAHGSFTWPAPEPSASFRTAGLIFRMPDRLAGILSPGFPLLLAPAFLVGAPMLVGPLLASALVLATWFVAREIALACGEPDARAEVIARAAVGLSVLSAALRQCTADAVPEGATATLVAFALGIALHARRTENLRLFAAAGLALGLLGSTQPLAAVPVGAVALAIAWGSRERWRGLGLGLVGALPGAALWLMASRAATGSAFTSPAAFYASGIGPGAALHPSTREVALGALRGLRAHLIGAGNFEPLALLAVVPVFPASTRLGQSRRPAVRGAPGVGSRGVLLAALVVGGEMALVLFLFLIGALHVSGTGVLLAVVPLEQALVAVALARLLPGSLVPAALATASVALAGFAVHTSHDHERVATGGIGRPRFEPDEAREANVPHGLLFFDDDEGYALAHEPGLAASHGVQAVRMRSDDHDRLLFDLLGHPQTHRYIATPLSVAVPAWSPPGGSNDTWRFEAENDWPPAAHKGARAAVLDATGVSCASDARALLVEPETPPGGSVTLALPLPRGATLPERTSWVVVPRVIQRGGAGAGTIDLVLEPDDKPLTTWTWSDALSGNTKTPTCTELPGRSVEVGKASRAWLIVRAAGGDVAVDKTTLRPR
jgi:hypothetical protein